MSVERKRQKTDYRGVSYRIVSRKGSPGTEKMFYVRYKTTEGKIIEAKAGRQYADNMTAAKANTLRADYIEKRKLPPQLQRAENRRKVWTLDNLSEEYFSQRKDGKSKRTDQGRYDLYIKPVLGKKQPKKILNLDIKRLHKGMEGKSPQTVKHVLTLLKRISNYGKINQLCEGLTVHFEMPRVNKGKTEDLTPDQVKRLVAVLDNHPDQVVCNIIRLAMFTGMRKGEILKLKWPDVDFHRKTIFIRDPKGGDGAYIPLNLHAEKVLMGATRHPRSDFVFPGRSGGHRVEVSKRCREIKEAADLPKDFRMLHGLRHFFASSLASSGRVDLYTLQRLLNHADPRMTQRYAHLRDEALKDASSLAGNLVLGGGQ